MTAVEAALGVVAVLGPAAVVLRSTVDRPPAPVAEPPEQPAPEQPAPEQPAPPLPAIPDEVPEEVVEDEAPAPAGLAALPLSGELRAAPLRRVSSALALLVVTLVVAGAFAAAIYRGLLAVWPD